MKKKNRGKNRKQILKTSRSGFVDPQSLFVLDQFTDLDLARWEKGSKALAEFNNRFFSCLESQRRTHYEDLCAVLSNSSNLTIKVADWYRIIDYQFGDDPLSARGHRFHYGGRFNFGVRLNPSFESFPAVYLASNQETAMKEKFGLSSRHSSGLSVHDFALMPNGSTVTLLVRGVIRNVFDLRAQEALKSFVKIISNFKLTEDIKRTARELKIKLKPLVRTPKQLMDTLLCEDWRKSPTGFDLPANSQVFGKFLRDSGFEGVIYRSARGSGDCLCIFVENLERSASFLELAGPRPESVKISRLDKDTWRSLI